MRRILAVLLCLSLLLPLFSACYSRRKTAGKESLP